MFAEKGVEAAVKHLVVGLGPSISGQVGSQEDQRDLDLSVRLHAHLSLCLTAIAC